MQWMLASPVDARRFPAATHVNPARRGRLRSGPRRSGAVSGVGRDGAPQHLVRSTVLVFHVDKLLAVEVEDEQSDGR